MGFDDIAAQGAAIGVVKKALASGKVPHAYLFAGPPGVGKLLAARTLAMALNCEEQTNDACGKCESCRKIGRNTHPDLFFLTVGEAKTRIAIAAVREIERMLATRPHEGRAKVAIIEPADMMSEAAANAILKTLEEPRLGSFLILVTSRAAALPPTVRSRCQLVRFRPLPQEAVSKILQNGGAEPVGAATAAALSQGSAERALHFMDESLGDRIDVAFGLLEGALQPVPLKGLDAAAAFMGDSARDDAAEVLDLIMVVLSEVMWAKSCGTGDVDKAYGVLVHRLGERLEKLADSLTLDSTAAFVRAAHRALDGIRNMNANPRLALEGMLMSMRGHDLEALRR